jgi:hypothetical protein
MAERQRRISWRPLVRSLHRDAGYLAVGLTLVYALSGLAVNHIADWDPNFVTYRTRFELRTALPEEPAAAARIVLERLNIRQTPREVVPLGPGRLDILLDGRTLHVDPRTGRGVDEGQRSRYLLRTANWLHLNRGKKAWTVVADAYAAGLLFLALSGMFMLPGRHGMRGRGGILVAVGVAVPLLYVTLSGGPEAHGGREPQPAPGADRVAPADSRETRKETETGAPGATGSPGERP